MSYTGIITDKQRAYFYDCYQVNLDTGCWIWKPKARHPFGYGLASIGSYTDGTHKQVTAHRLSYELSYGPVPDGLLVCHHCDVPDCVNPDHLYAGTYVDNMRDAAERDRCHRKPFPKGEDAYRAKLTDKDVADIRASSEKNVTLARQYGVTPEYISRIKRRHERK